MRIWINNPFDNVPGEGGRPHRYTFLAQALSDAGHEVVLWSSDFSHPLKRKRVLNLAETKYRVILLPTRPYADNVCLNRALSHYEYARSWRQTALAAVNSRDMKAPHIILTSMPPLEIGLAAQTLQRVFACKLVVDIQDAWPETFYRLLPLPAWMRPFFGKVIFALYHHRAKKIYTKADRVTAVAESYLELARSYGACNVAREPFYLGTNVAVDSASRHVAPRKVGSVLNMIYVGIMGRMHDLATVIACVGRDSRVYFHLAGAGPDEKRLKRLAAGRPNIIFHGYLADTQLHGLLNEMDVGVLPMKRESYVAVPNKLIDYAAHGLPILSSLGGESAALLKRYQAGITYIPGKNESLQHGVDLLREDREQRVRLGQGAFRLACEQFDARKIYAAFVKELEEIGYGMAE